MQHAIERLRSSKHRHEMDQTILRRAEARQWAEHSAEYIDLVSLAKLNIPKGASNEEAHSLIEESVSSTEFIGGYSLRWRTGEIRAFLEDVTTFYDSVRDQLGEPMKDVTPKQWKIEEQRNRLGGSRFDDLNEIPF